MLRLERLSHLFKSLHERMRREASTEADSLAQALRGTYQDAEYTLTEIALAAGRVKAEYRASEMSVQINMALFNRLMKTTRDIDDILTDTEDAICIRISDATRCQEIQRYARLGGYRHWVAVFGLPTIPKELEILGKLRLLHYSEALAEVGLHVPGTPQTLPDRV